LLYLSDSDYETSRPRHGFGSKGNSNILPPRPRRFQSLPMSKTNLDEVRTDDILMTWLSDLRRYDDKLDYRVQMALDRLRNAMKTLSRTRTQLGGLRDFNPKVTEAKKKVTKAQRDVIDRLMEHQKGLKELSIAEAEASGFAERVRAREYKLPVPPPGQPFVHPLPHSFTNAYTPHAFPRVVPPFPPVPPTGQAFANGTNMGGTQRQDAGADVSGQLADIRAQLIRMWEAIGKSPSFKNTTTARSAAVESEVDEGDTTAPETTAKSSAEEKPAAAPVNNLPQETTRQPTTRADSSSTAFSNDKSVEELNRTQSKPASAETSKELPSTRERDRYRKAATASNYSDEEKSSTRKRRHHHRRRERDGWDTYI
jgi:hypothetical protein